MIKQREIRTGNLFYAIDRNGRIHLPIHFPLVIHTIGLFEVETLPIGINPSNVEKLNPVRIADLYPIALTEEILLNAGFEKSGTYLFLGDVYIYELGLLNISFIYKVNYRQIEIKSVHQLQNLYFALTGEELKVNL